MIYSVSYKTYNFLFIFSFTGLQVQHSGKAVDSCSKDKGKEFKTDPHQQHEKKAKS